MDYKSIVAYGESAKYEKITSLGGTKSVVDDSSVDVDSLAERIADACNRLDRDGYEVVSILPVARGAVREHAGGDVAFNPTFAAVVTGRRPAGTAPP